VVYLEGVSLLLSFWVYVSRINERCLLYITKWFYILSKAMKRARCFLVTYAQSGIGDEDRFEELLKARLKEAKVLRRGYRYGRPKEHVPSRLYGVHEIRRDQQSGEVTCSITHRYEVLVLFDNNVGFEGLDHMKVTFDVGDGSSVMVRQPEGEVRWNGEGFGATDEQERKFVEQVQAYVERLVESEVVERRLFGKRFDVAEEFRHFEERSMFYA
jgi:hypothetical protein